MLLLIEPLWNGNSKHWCECYGSGIASNRTIVEWKRETGIGRNRQHTASNRTIVEWKLAIVNGMSAATLSSNRTIVEWKPL